MSSKSQIIDYLNDNPNITHVLITTIIDAKSGDDTNRRMTRAFNTGATNVVFNGNQINIRWNAHGKQSTRFFTTYSIYSDTVTLYHGRVSANQISEQIGKEIRATVLKKLEFDNLSLEEFNSLIESAISKEIDEIEL